MLVIFFVPFSFFYFFSLGSHHFGKLPFLGPDRSGTPFVIGDFPIGGSNAEIDRFYDLKGNIVIATVVTKDCPYTCDLAAKQMRFMVYKELVKEEKFKDVVIVSDLIDTLAKPRNVAGNLDVESKKWIVYTTDDHSMWDVELNGNVLSKTEDPDHPGKMLYTRSILLLDKEMRVRGYYDGSQTVDLKRLLDELRLLTKEYEKRN